MFHRWCHMGFETVLPTTLFRGAPIVGSPTIWTTFFALLCNTQMTMVLSHPSLQQNAIDSSLPHSSFDDNDIIEMCISAVISQDDDSSNNETMEAVTSVTKMTPTRRSPRRPRNRPVVDADDPPLTMALPPMIKSSPSTATATPAEPPVPRSSSNNNRRKRKSIMPPSTKVAPVPPPPSTLPAIESTAAAIATDVATTSTRLTLTLDTTTSATATTTMEPLQTPPSSTLKPLIAKTPLKEDGTPALNQKPPRPVRDNYDVFMSLTDSTTNTMSAPNSPLAAAPHLPALLQEQQESTAAPTVSMEQLRERMIVLFPILQEPKYSQMNCVAARLFASFSLSAAAAAAAPTTDNTSSTVSSPSPRKRPRRQVHNKAKEEQAALSALHPIHPLLTALVDLELAVLQDEKTVGGAGYRRRVHFAAFDFSALQPPSDVLEHSHKHQQAAIDALRRVLQTIDELKQQQQQQPQAGARPLLQELVWYLQRNYGDTASQDHGELCAQSLSNRFMDFPVQRIVKAAERYAQDLQQLVEEDSWWNTTTTTAEEDPNTKKKATLSWHCRLADASAQLVRYWLRTKLNPVPDRAPTSRSDGWNTRVCDIVKLEAPEQEDSTEIRKDAIEDLSLSSLVSNAASHICHHFGIDWRGWKQTLDETPQDFLANASELCQTGIACKSGVVLKEFTSNDWQDASERVELATSFLGAVNGAKFLYDLLTVVVHHDDHLQSWQQTIQESALQLAQCSESLQDPDAHLLLLQYSPQTLLQQLPLLIHWTRKRSCELFLSKLPKQFLFHCKDKSNRKRPYQPYVGQLQHAFQQAMSKVVFPTVVVVHDDDDDE